MIEKFSDKQFLIKIRKDQGRVCGREGTQYIKMDRAIRWVERGENDGTNKVTDKENWEGESLKEIQTVNEREKDREREIKLGEEWHTNRPKESTKFTGKRDV